ncbi:MAG: hypothetical protein ACQERC_00260 [Bacteroidota bacterium]
MKFVLTIGFLLLLFGSIEQELIATNYDTLVRSQGIVVEGNAFYHTTSLKNEFSEKFLFGGYINQDVKNNTLNSHDGRNRLGGGTRFKATYYNAEKPIFSNKNIGWQISFGQNTHLSGSYKSDLFQLLMFGNQSFNYEQANFSNTYFSYTNFWTIGFGVHHKKTKSFVTLNAILPRNDVQIGITRGVLQRNQSNEALDLDLLSDMELMKSYPFFKGAGISLDFDYYVPFNTSIGKSNTFKGTFKISARNIGGYLLNEVESFSVDNSLLFEGFPLNVIQQDEENVEELMMDTLGATMNNGQRMRWSPGFIQAGKIVESNSNHKLQSFFGIRMYTNLNYQPLIYLGGEYRLMENFSFGIQGSYGGYGNFRIGSYIHFIIDQLTIGIGSEDMLGLFSNEHYGNSALINLSWSW